MRGPRLAKTDPDGRMAGLGPVPSDDRLSSGSLAPTQTVSYGGDNVKRIAFLAVAALVLAAGPALASNTGFKLNMEFTVAGNSFKAFPYFYFPDGDVANTTQTAQDTCCDLDADGVMAAGPDCPFQGGGDCHVLSITHFTATGSPFAAPCGSPLFNFDLMAYEGLVVEVQGTCTANVVGSHDDNYSFNKGSSMIPVYGGRENLLAVPYHIMQVDAQELCDFIEIEFGDGNASSFETISQLTYFTAAGAPFTKPCAAPIFNFDLNAGDAVYHKLETGVGDTNIQFETY